MAHRVHFIGICGTAMATVAAMLKQRGWDVRGSDHGIYPPMSTFLETEGIRALDGYKAENITSDLELVVVGNAISRGNPELEAVLEKKIRYCSLPEIVREQFLWGARSVVIAGTHGKTTTTSLVGWVLADGGLDPSVLVGGIAANFNASYRLGNGRHFVLEGDEYDSAFFDKTAKFLKYLPDIAVVNNIEFDHADIYPDIDAVHLAFKRLALLVPRNGLLLLGSDSPLAASLAERSFAPVETFGTGDAPAVASTNGSGAKPASAAAASGTGRVRQRSARALAGDRHQGDRFRHRVQSEALRHADRHVRDSAARPAQRAQRARGDCRRRVGRARHRARSPAAWSAFRASSGGWNCAAASTGFACMTTSRIIPPRSPKRSRRCASRIRTSASGPSSSRAPRHHA